MAGLPVHYSSTSACCGICSCCTVQHTIAPTSLHNSPSICASGTSLRRHLQKSGMPHGCWTIPHLQLRQEALSALPYKWQGSNSLYFSMINLTSASDPTDGHILDTLPRWVQQLSQLLAAYPHTLGFVYSHPALTANALISSSANASCASQLSLLHVERGLGNTVQGLACTQLTTPRQHPTRRSRSCCRNQAPILLLLQMQLHRVAELSQRQLQGCCQVWLLLPV